MPHPARTYAGTVPISASVRSAEGRRLGVLGSATQATSTPAKRATAWQRALPTLATAWLIAGGDAQGQFVVSGQSSMELPSGSSVDTACIPVEVHGTLTLDSAAFSTGSSLSIAGSGSLTGRAGRLEVGGNLTSAGTFDARTSTVALVDGCAGNTTVVSGTMVVGDLTLQSSTGRTFMFPNDSQITVLGTLSLLGVAGAEIKLASSGPGTSTINLGPNATVSQTFASVGTGVHLGAPVPHAAQAIPTLGTWSLLVTALLLSLAALHRGIPTAVASGRGHAPPPETTP